MAISNGRLRALDLKARTVAFAYKDYAHGHQHKTLVLPAAEFLRRFLLHVLPQGFTKIRHYGLLGNNQRQRRVPLARAALEQSPASLPTQTRRRAPRPSVGTAQVPPLPGHHPSLCGPYRCLRQMDLLRRRHPVTGRPDTRIAHDPLRTQAQRRLSQPAARFAPRDGPTPVLSTSAPGHQHARQFLADRLRDGYSRLHAAYGETLYILSYDLSRRETQTTFPIATGPTQRLRPTHEVSSAPGYDLPDSSRLSRARCLPRIFVRRLCHISYHQCRTDTKT